MAEPKSLTDNIPHEYILMPNIKGKDKPFGIGKKWSLEQAQHKLTEDRNISVVYYLKDTNYAVVDIDTDDYSLDQLYDDTGIDNMWVKGNSKGYHVWVEFPNGKPDAYRKNVVNCSNLCEMDFLGEKVFERVGKTWTGEEPCHIHAEQFKKCFIMEKLQPKPKKTEKAEITQSSSDKALLKKMVDLIDMKYCDNRDDWLKIVYAMKKCGFTEEETNSWSMKSQRYTENGFDSAWEQYPVDLITATEGTIRYYANLSNSGEYKKMTVKIFSTDTMDIQKLIALKSDVVIKKATDEEIEAVEKLNAKEKKKAEEQLKTTADGLLWKRYFDEMNIKTKYFEQYHAKIIQPPAFLRLSNKKAHLMTPKDIGIQYENVSVIKPSDNGPKSVAYTNEWRLREDIRTFENVDFLPPPLVCEESTFNMYFGLRAESLPPVADNIDISLFHSHLHILCGEEERATEYVLNYLAHLVQFPGTLPRVALVFISNQGVGKNIFFENFAKSVLGTDLYLQTDNMDKLIGKFNMNHNKLMLIMDEVQGRDSFANSEAIKNMITAEDLQWERKGCDPVTVINCGRCIMFSNNMTPVKIEASDRRFMLMECSEKVRNNTEYFKKLNTFLKDDANARAIYDMLMKRDLSSWDSTNDRVITKAYKDIQSMTIPPMALFLESKLLEYENVGSFSSVGGQDAQDMTKLPSAELFKEFNHWLSENGFAKMEYTITKYGREIVSYEGITKKRLEKGMTILIDYAILKDGLVKKGFHVPNVGYV